MSTSSWSCILHRHLIFPWCKPNTPQTHRKKYQQTVTTKRQTHHQLVRVCHVESLSRRQHCLNATCSIPFNHEWITDYHGLPWIPMDYPPFRLAQDVGYVGHWQWMRCEWHTKRSSCPHRSATSLTNPSQPSRVLQSPWMYNPSGSDAATAFPSCTEAWPQTVQLNMFHLKCATGRGQLGISQ